MLAEMEKQSNYLRVIRNGVLAFFIIFIAIPVVLGVILSFTR